MVAWRVDHLAMRLDLGAQRVEVTTELRVSPESGVPAPELNGLDSPLVLDGRGLELLEVRIDGEVAAADRYVQTDRTLTVPLSPGEHVVATRVAVVPGGVNDAGVTTRPGLLSSTCEPHGFRRITYALDAPHNRATFEVTLVAERETYPVLLSNGHLVDSGTLPDGRHWARFDDPIPKPTYLFSFVAGDLRIESRPYRTRSGRQIDLRVAALADQIDGADFALDRMADVMAFDEANGGIEHDLDVLTFVAIPGYPDATEYHGLMFFESSILVVDQRGHVDDDLLLISANIAHEYGHHVRGNRVTVRSWGQLALKEGLTVLMGQNDYRRHWLGPVGRVMDVLDLRRLQFPEELTMGAPVVRGEVDDPSQLYTRTTYLKGAEIFGMLRTVVGDETWAAVFAEFVRRHDLGATGVDEFVAVAREVAPEHAASIDGIARWFVMAGRPALVLTVGHEDGAVVVDAHRTDGLTDDPPLAIPVALAVRSLDGREVVAPRVEMLDGRSARWVLRPDVAVPSGDLVLSPLRGYSAPIDLTCSLPVEHLASLIRHDDDAFVRWWASEELMIGAIDAHRQGRLDEVEPYVDALAGALRGVMRSDHIDPMLLAQLLALPDEFMLGDREARVDVDGVGNGLAHVRAALGTALHDDLIGMLEPPTAEAAGGHDAQQIAERSLVEPVLALLLATGSAEALDAAHLQLASPDATRSVRALGQLLHLDSVDADALLDQTFRRWETAPKLIDRWLRAQSGARRHDTIERVARLAGGPLYDRSDRSRVMAIWFPFATRNRTVFHDRSGDGYRLFTDELIELMPLNAGLAVRLVGDLLQFQRFDDTRRALLRAELSRMASADGMPAFAVGIIEQLLAQP